MRPQLEGAGLSMTYNGGHRQRLILAPAGDAVTLPLSRFLQAISLFSYRNEFAGTVWQTDGTRTVEMIFYDANECTSTVMRQDVNVVSKQAAPAGAATGLPSACLDNLNATATDASQLSICAKSATSAAAIGRSQQLGALLGVAAVGVAGLVF